jgi:hypothetical protein
MTIMVKQKGDLDGGNGKKKKKKEERKTRGEERK